MLFVFCERNPVGHTHEDIDRSFSVLWRYFQGRIVHTPNDYEQCMRDAYKRASYHLDIIDVYCVPDYVAWLEPHITEVGAAFKEKYTQLQFK